MPKLLVFAPCEKAIIDEQDNAACLITLIESFTIDVPEGIEVPGYASLPIAWCIFALWEKTEGDDSRIFEQRAELTMPGGRKAADVVASLAFDPKRRRHRWITNVRGFPLSPSGACTLKLSLREVGQNTWQDVADYPIYVGRRPKRPQGGAVADAAKPEDTEVR